MRFLILIAVVLFVSFFASAEEVKSYVIDNEGKVYRLPDYGTTGKDVKAIEALAKEFPIMCYIILKPGTRKAVKPKKGDQGKEGLGKKDRTNKPKLPHPDNAWPPKEVEPEAVLPTLRELSDLEQHYKRFKRSGKEADRKLGVDLKWSIVKRMKITTTTDLKQKDFADRFEALKKINVLSRKYEGSEVGMNLWPKFRDWASQAKSHGDFFKKCRWAYRNGKVHKAKKDNIRQLVYLYIEANPEKFKTTAIKRKFCLQLIRGGVKDLELEEMSKTLE